MEDVGGFGGPGGDGALAGSDEESWPGGEGSGGGEEGEDLGVGRWELGDGVRALKKIDLGGGDLERSLGRKRGLQVFPKVGKAEWGKSGGSLE